MNDILGIAVENLGVYHESRTIIHKHSINYVHTRNRSVIGHFDVSRT